MGKRTIQLLCIALAVAAGFLSHLWWFSGQTPVHDENSKPLYWVAPMDPNYQRDQPGKSPMGMDLIPVYPRDITHASKGSIQLTPTISHGLGVRTAPVILRQTSATHLGQWGLSHSTRSFWFICIPELTVGSTNYSSPPPGTWCLVDNLYCHCTHPRSPMLRKNSSLLLTMARRQ